MDKQTFWVRLEGNDLRQMHEMHQWPNQARTSYAALITAALKFYYENYYRKLPPATKLTQE